MLQKEWRVICTTQKHRCGCSPANIRKLRSLHPRCFYDRRFLLRLKYFSHYTDLPCREAEGPHLLKVPLWNIIGLVRCARTSKSALFRFGTATAARVPSRVSVVF